MASRFNACPTGCGAQKFFTSNYCRRCSDKLRGERMRGQPSKATWTPNPAGGTGLGASTCGCGNRKRRPESKCHACRTQTGVHCPTCGVGNATHPRCGGDGYSDMDRFACGVKLGPGHPFRTAPDGIHCEECWKNRMHHESRTDEQRRQSLQAWELVVATIDD